MLISSTVASYLGFLFGVLLGFAIGMFNIIGGLLKWFREQL